MESLACVAHGAPYSSTSSGGILPPAAGGWGRDPPTFGADNMGQVQLASESSGERSVHKRGNGPCHPAP